MVTTIRRLGLPVFLLTCSAASAAVSSSFAGGTLTVSSNGADSIAVGCTGIGGNVTVNGGNPGTGAVACSAVTSLVVTGGPGANTIDLAAISGATYPALSSRTVDGGAGSDTIAGSGLSDIILGSGDVDTIDGNFGNDVVFLGDGNDTFVWNPADGNDTVEGQTGTDTLQFNGSGATESLDLAANGGRLRLLRDVSNVTLDLDDVEHVTMNVFGSNDTIVVNPLVGTDATQVAISLSSATPGVGDSVADGVIINGGAGADTLTADASGGAISVVAASTTVVITVAEPANDWLTLNGLGGNDTIVVGAALAGLLNTLAVDGGLDSDTVVARGTAGPDTLQVNAVSPFLVVGPAALVHTLASENVQLEGLGGTDALLAFGSFAGLFALTFDGGTGTDTLTGGDGNDILIGGDDADQIDGRFGADIVFLGDGDDTFTWNPGGANDTIEGQAGIDRLIVNGSGANEAIELSANGGRLWFTRNVSLVTLDVNDVEQVDFNAVGGADTLTANDLTATDVVATRFLLAGTLGGSSGDAQVDLVTVNAGAAADTIALSGSSGIVTVTRAGRSVSVHTAEVANDRLTINALGSDDIVSVSAVAAAQLPIVVEGGADSGVQGDAFVLTGEAFAETYSIAPNAARVALSRNVPSAFTLDLGTLESLQLAADAGADTVNTQGLTSMRQALDGGAPSVVPADTLNVAGFSGNVLLSPVVIPGFQPIAHSDFEQTQNPLVIEAFLTGWQETPPNLSPGRGFGTVSLSTAQDAITVSLTYSGLSGINTLAHIHGPAPRGVAAPPIIDLPVSGATNGNFTIGPIAVTPTQAAQLKSGQWYINLHSTTFAGGEIRGQIDNIQFRDGFE